MHKFTLAMSVAPIALMAGAPAFAADTAATPAIDEAKGAASAAPADGLDDIVVTAQRKSESAQRAAIAIDVVSPSTLAAAGVVAASTLNSVTPSLTIQQGGGANTTFFIRGVGNYTNNGYSDPAIAFNLDGVYLGRSTSTTGTFYDLERIEVLKGPQGTLYGRNATGGAINVLPNKPKLGQNSLDISTGVGSQSSFDLAGAINLALGDNAAFRVAGTIVSHGGYNSDGTSDEKGEGLRAQLLFNPSAGLSVRIAGDYSHQGGVGIGLNYIGVENYVPASGSKPESYTFARGPAGLRPWLGMKAPVAKSFFSGVVTGAGVNPAPLAPAYQNNSYWGVQAEVNADLGIGNLTVIPAYRHANIDTLFNGPSFRAMMPMEQDGQFSLEARLAGTRVGPIEWLLGAYYFDEQVDGQYSFNIYQLNSFQVFTSKTKSYAGFGRLTAHLNDRLRLVGGLRYTQDSKNVDANVQTLVQICAAHSCIGGPSIPVVRKLADIPNGPTLPFTPVPFGTNGNLLLFIPTKLNSAIDAGKVTYRLGAEFDAGPHSLLYASYETGARSGGFSLASGYETFKPETVSALTLGSKNRFFNNSLQFNVELFNWQYKDQQVSHFGTDGTGAPNVFTQNIGQTRIRGFDVDAQWLVTPTTQLSGTIEFLDTKVKAFSFDNPRGGGNTAPATGCAVDATAVNSSKAPVYRISCAGKPAYSSPKWSINAGINQTIPLDVYKIDLSGEARYRSSSVVGFEYLPQQSTGDNLTLDASVAFGPETDSWTITGFVRNITNRPVLTSVQYSGGNGSLITGTYAPPRTYGIRATAKF